MGASVKLIAKTGTPVRLAPGVYSWNGYAIYRASARGLRNTGRNRRGGATARIVEWRIAHVSAMNGVEIVDYLKERSGAADTAFETLNEAKEYLKELFAKVAEVKKDLP